MESLLGGTVHHVHDEIIFHADDPALMRAVKMFSYVKTAKQMQEEFQNSVGRVLGISP